MAEYDGPQVLSLIDSQSLAPMLFDIGLPASDGSEILRFVRQKSTHSLIILMIGINSLIYYHYWRSRRIRDSRCYIGYSRSRITIMPKALTR